MTTFTHTERVKCPEVWGPDAHVTLRAIIREEAQTGPSVLLLHGAGHNSLVWCRSAFGLARRGFRVFAYDFRGHGETTVGECNQHPGVVTEQASGSDVNIADDFAGQIDMSMAALVSDTHVILKHIVEKYGPKDRSASQENRVAIVGHSLGGAVAVRTCEAYPKLVSACSVVDLVEGTAIASLPFLKTFLEGRPRSFPNIQAALHWALDSGYVQSLRQSLDAFPSQLRPLSSVADAIQPAANGTLGDDDHDVNSDGDLDPLDSKPPASVAGCAAFLNSKGPVKWRTDLLATQPYWQAWYTGLSQVFLGLRVPKLLIVADLNRLDTPLTIAQMNGKIQLSLAPRGAGHNIPEAAGDWLAMTVAKFVSRHCHAKVRVNVPSLAPPKRDSFGGSLLDTDSSIAQLRKDLIISTATKAPKAVQTDIIKQHRVPAHKRSLSTSSADGGPKKQSGHDQPSSTTAANEKT